jgi:hypothetical protein
LRLPPNSKVAILTAFCQNKCIAARLGGCCVLHPANAFADKTQRGTRLGTAGRMPAILSLLLSKQIQLLKSQLKLLQLFLESAF